MHYDVTATSPMRTVYYVKACLHATVTATVCCHRHNLAASKVTPLAPLSKMYWPVL